MATFWAQWEKVKNQYPDKLVLIQLGDFYEALGDDAQVLADACDLHVLRRRARPMAGFPVSCFESYEPQLPAYVLVDQTGPLVCGCVPRGVVRVIEKETP